MEDGRAAQIDEGHPCSGSWDVEVELEAEMELEPVVVPKLELEPGREDKVRVGVLAQDLRPGGSSNGIYDIHMSAPNLH